MDKIKKAKKLLLVTELKTPSEVKLLKHIDSVVEELEQSDAEIVSNLEKKIEDKILEVKDSFPTFEEVVESIEIPEPIKGDPGEPGTNYILTDQDKQEIAQSIIVPVVEKEIRTIVEKTEVIKETPIVTQNTIEKALYETPNQTIHRINNADDLISKTRIEGYFELERLLKQNAFNPTMGPSFSDLANINKRIDGLGAGGVTSFNTRTGAVTLTSGDVTTALGFTPGQGTVTSVSGTTNRITSSGGTTPVIDISVNYVGQASITTVGTLSSGAVPASLVTAGTFGTGAYTMNTSLTNPLLIGGTAVGSSLTLKSTSGVGTTDYINAVVGSNGGTEVWRGLSNGYFGIGTTNAQGIFDVNGLATVSNVNGMGYYGVNAQYPFYLIDVRSNASITQISPLMTSNSTPSPYVALASSEANASNQAYQAFTNGTNPKWTSNTGTPAWVQLDFNKKVVVQSYKMTQSTGSNSFNPLAWTWAGSNDGSSFTTIETRSGIVWVSNVTQTFTTTNTTYYRYYRMTVTTNNGGGLVEIDNLQLMQVGTPILQADSTILQSFSTALNFTAATMTIGAAGGVTTITTPGTALKFQETGGSDGTVSLTLSNQSGANGATFANASLDLVDFIFNPSSGVSQTIRYEHRSAFLFASGNTAGEWQVGAHDFPPFITGPAVTSVRLGNFGVGGVVSPTARLHLGAGTATASTSPAKWTSGPLLTAPEVGADEFLTDKRYFTITTGTARKEYTLNDATLTPGIVPVATTNGRLTDSTLTATKIIKPLFDHFADAGNGTTVETDLYSDTTAAGQLANNGDKLESEVGGVFVSSATATRQVKQYFGGTMIFDTGALTLSLSSAWTMYTTIIRVSATVIRYMISFTTEGAALAAYTAVGEVTGLTLSGTNILKITGQAAGVGAATNDIVAKLGSINYSPSS